MSASDPQRRHPNRRTFLAGSLAAGAAAALAACSSRSTGPGSNLTSQPTSVPPALAGPIEAAEAARPRTGRTVSATLNPRPVTVDLGGKVVRTLGYADSVPGPLIRAKSGS